MKIAEIAALLDRPVEKLTTGINAVLQQMWNEIARVSGSSSQVHFKAFDGDQGLEAVEQAYPDGFSWQLVVMAPGMISFRAN